MAPLLFRCLGFYLRVAKIWPMGVYNGLAALVADIASFVVGSIQVFVTPQCCAVHLKS